MSSKIGEAYVEIRTNQAKFSNELKSMEKTVKTSTDRMKKNFDRIGKGVSEISRTARLGFLAMSAAIAGTVYAAAKYEKQMATVSTMLTRKSMPVMEKYKDLVGKMGIIFGESTETLSKGLYDILSASIRPEKALKVLAVSAKAAAAGLTDTGVAADAITTIINSYGYAAEDAGMISDKLFTIIARGKTTFAELGPNIGKVAATAAMAGFSFDDLGATIATVTRAGIRTEMAMTAINGVLKVFIKPTDEAKEAAREFGLELDTNTLQTIGFTGVLEKLNGATAEQLALIFPEIEGLKGLAAAVGDLTGYTDDYRAMLESAGATQEAYLKQTNTLTFTFNQLKEAGKYLAVQVGEIFTPIVSQAIKKITDQAIKLGQAIKELTSGQKNSVAQMVLFGTAVLGAIGSLSLFAVAARLVMAAGSVIAGVLGLIFSPLGLLIVGIGALVLAWTLGWKKIKEITSKLIEVVVMPSIKWGSGKLDSLADWMREKSGLPKDKNDYFDLGDFKAMVGFMGELIWKGMKSLGKTIDDLALWIQEKMGISEEVRKGAWELTDISVLLGFIADLVWKGITSAGKAITDITEWIKENAKIEKIDQLGTRVEQFFIDLPEPAKWMFLIAGKAFQYTALAYGIWSAVNALISKLKLPALTPIRLTFDIILVVGTFLIGWDVGKWIQENIKPVSDFIQKEVDKFQEKHPLLWKQFITAPLISTTGIKAIALYISEAIVSAIDLGFEAAAEFIGGIVEEWIVKPIGKAFREADWGRVWTDFVNGMIWPFKKIWAGIKWEWLKFENLIVALKKAWEDIDWSWFGFDKVKDFFKDIWESFDWSWLSWENFVTSLQEAWDNTDWGWFGNSIKWLFGLFKKDIERAAVALEVDWKIWPKADEDTKKVIDNIDKIAKTVEKEIGTKIPKELQLMSVALIASESSFNKNAKAVDKLGNEYRGLGQTGKAAIKDLKKMGLVIDDINDPTQAASATMAYFTKILKANGGDVKKSILIYKGWGKELAKQGGNIEKMPKEAKRQLDIYLKLLEDFAGDSLFYGTLAGKQFVWGSSPGGVVGEMEAGQKDLRNNLEQMTGQMGKMVDGMSKIFMPIIDMFKMIFVKVIAVIKEFDEEAGTELENFVNETMGLIDDMFGGIEEGAGEMSLEVIRLFRDIEVKVKDTTEDIADDTTTMWERMTESIKKWSETIEEHFLDAFVNMTRGVKEGENAVVAFGESLLNLIYSIPIIGQIAEGFVNILKAIGATTLEAQLMGLALEALASIPDAIEESMEDLSEAFKDVGASLTGSINDAERAIRDLQQAQEDLALNTREKLIKELDKYYDWRVLNEMSLDELLAKSAETRLAIEAGTLEEIAETAEEAAEREKAAKVSTLQAIEDAYAKESALIDKKIGLLQVEIKLLMAAAEAEKGNLEEAKRLRAEANFELSRLLYTEEELLEMQKKGHEKRKKFWGDIIGFTKDATDATKEYGREGKRAADDVRGGFGRTREQIEDLKNSTNQARIGIEQWGEDGRRNAQKITEGFKEARIGIELWGKEINKIPRRIDFDIVGDLHMPSIPRIGDQSFQIRGIYAEPYIPSYQVGIPYVPRTHIAELHPKEAVLTAPQAEEWRAGKGGGGGNTFNTRILNTGDLRSDVDLEQFVRKVADRITRNMERV